MWGGLSRGPRYQRAERVQRSIAGTLQLARLPRPAPDKAASRSSASRRAESEGPRPSTAPAVQADRECVTMAKRPAGRQRRQSLACPNRRRATRSCQGPRRSPTSDHHSSYGAVGAMMAPHAPEVRMWATASDSRCGGGHRACSAAPLEGGSRGASLPTRATGSRPARSARGIPPHVSRNPPSIWASRRATARACSKALGDPKTKSRNLLPQTADGGTAPTKSAGAGRLNRGVQPSLIPSL